MEGGFDLGFLGGGQLARMSIQAAQRMGLRCLSLDPDPVSPASQIGPCVAGRLSDPESVARLVRPCRRVTLENEFIPAHTIAEAFQEAKRDPGVMIPGLETLAVIQDKLAQRQAYERAGVPAPKAVAIDDDGALAIAKIGFPMVLKARFGGYDGRGTRFARNPEEFEEHRSVWAGGGWMAEAFVPFKRELAVMVYRWVASPPAAPKARIEAGCFPTMETVQRDHVCDLVFPADADGSRIAIAAVEAVEGLGLYGVELFETEDGQLSVNEIAPRPHNTGHYTLDWGGISQFDQHVRVCMGMPPGPLDGVPACMANLLGQPGAKDWRRGLLAALAGDAGIRVHWYGKQETRPGRKMGHLNAVGGDIVGRAVAARERFYAAWTDRAPGDRGGDPGDPRTEED
jgi:5-(carboxyamino)imidazole ribonucleotide synthase